jgi:hypothetical protein
MNDYKGMIPKSDITKMAEQKQFGSTLPHKRPNTTSQEQNYYSRGAESITQWKSVCLICMRP